PRPVFYSLSLHDALPISATYPYGAAPGLQRLSDAVAADQAPGREVGALDVLHDHLVVGLGVVDEGDEGIDDLAQVVRSEVGSHAHRDAGGAVHDEVGDR